MAEVDNLYIQIEADAKGAEKSLDLLVSKLDSMYGSLGRVGKGSTSNFNQMSKNFKSMADSMGIIQSGIKGATLSFGKLFLTAKALKRGFDSLYNSIESAMDSIETYNFFSVSLNKIGNDFEKTFEAFGYASAEAYSESFRNRMVDLLEDMTGYEIGKDGELMLGDSVGLGMDVQKLMDFQAKVLSVTNSVGLMGETSINTAKALSMLAGDLSSLTNTDLQTVMTNLQSGLIGQSRSLYKYGIDITNATLQVKAYELGLDKLVSEMTQGEKMQLRLLEILDQSRVAWGDLGNTLNSVANQSRITQQQFSNLSRTFGFLFMPAIKNILPVINGFIIAMNRLLTTLGFQIHGEDWLADVNEGISGGIGTDLEGLEEDLGGVKEKVEELKQSSRGWDELNILSSSSLGVDDASLDKFSSTVDLTEEIRNGVLEYEKAWKQAFENSEQLSEDWADKITPTLEGIVGTIGAFAPTLEGALAVFGALKTQQAIEKLAGHFAPLKDTVTTIVENLDATGQKLSVGNIMSGLRDRMSDTQKLLIGLGSVVTAFAGVSDGVEDLITGTGNIFSNVGEIVVSAGLASSALYLAFGPTGLAYAAVAGLAGAIKGIVDAGNEVADEKVGDIILGALTPTNGTPLEEVIDGVVESLQDVSGEFDELNNASEGLSTTRTNIGLVITEIEGIKTAMDNGVLSVETGKEKLTDAFTDLATLTQNKFADIRDGLISVIGDGGIVSKYLEKFGVDAEETVDVVINYTYRNEERVKEILADMKEVEFGSDEYKALELELIKLSKGYDELSDATNKFNLSVKGINWQSVLDASGNIDSQKLEKVFSSYNSALTELIGNLEKAELTTTTEFQRMLESGDLTKAEEENIKSALNALPKAFESIRKESEAEITDFVTMLQNDMIGKVNNVIKDAQDEWSKLSFWDRLVIGETETTFVMDALYKYLGEFNEVEKELKSHLDELGIDTSQMATDFNKDFISSLFDAEYVQGAQGYGEYVYTLKSNYSKMINELKKPTQQDAENLGKALVAGFNLAIGENEETKKKVQSFTDAVKKVFKKNLDIHSPSGVTEEYGKFFVQGFNIGIENNMQSTFDIIEEFMRKVRGKLPTFNLLGNSFGYTLPKYAAGGFPEDGLFMANHSELVGKFSNGRTAVANNDQITKGIAEAVRPAVYEAMTSALREGGMSANFKVEGDPNGIFRVVQQKANQYTKSTGRNAFG